MGYQKKKDKISIEINGGSKKKEIIFQKRPFDQRERCIICE